MDKVRKQDSLKRWTGICAKNVIQLPRYSEISPLSELYRRKLLKSEVWSRDICVWFMVS
jgi:hypothetical protein